MRNKILFIKEIKNVSNSNLFSALILKLPLINNLMFRENLSFHASLSF